MKDLYNMLMADLKQTIDKKAVMDSAARIGQVIGVYPGRKYDVQLSDGRIISEVVNNTNYSWQVGSGVTLEWSSVDWYIIGTSAQKAW